MNTVRHLNLPSLLLAVLLSLLAALAFSQRVAAATLTASVDRSSIARDETLTLSLKIDSRSILGQPDLSLLEPYFRILGQSKSTQLRSINGRAESSTQWDISLAPKIDGRILIPPFEFDGARSQPLQVEVVPPRQTPYNPNADSFLELSSDHDEIYVGQQLNIRLRLHTSVQLSDLEVEPLELDDAEVISLKEQQYQKSRDGRRFLVYELNYAVFPRSSGTLTVPGRRMKALKNGSRSLFDSRRGQTVRLLSQDLNITVKPRPDSTSAAQWLPANSLTIDQTLSQPDGGYRVGEPISRTLVLQAEGVQASHLPDLKLAPQASFKLYPEPPVLEQKTPASGLYASRTESYGLVPTRAGSLTLPAIEVHWWDTNRNQPRIAKVAAQTINVLPPLIAPQPQPNYSSAPPRAVAAAEPALTPATLPAAADNRWLLYSNLAWAALCLLLAGLLVRSKRAAVQPSPLPATTDQPLSASNNDEAEAFRALEAACRQGDWQTIRNALSRWRAAAGDAPMVDTAVNAQSQRLDASLYDASSVSEQTFDSAALLSAVKEYRQRQRGSEVGETGLPPLYR